MRASVVSGASPIWSAVASASMGVPSHERRTGDPIQRDIVFGATSSAGTIHASGVAMHVGMARLSSARTMLRAAAVPHATCCEGQEGNLLVLCMSPGTPRVYGYLREWPEKAEATTTGDLMSGSATVLVVDDDADVREIVTTLLEEDGYKVDTASNGAEALRVANRHQPDAIVLDVSMPVMDGWQFLDAWRARPPERRAPVLVVSVLRDWARAMNRGARAHLSKPFDIATLESTLASVL